MERRIGYCCIFYGDGQLGSLESMRGTTGGRAKGLGLSGLLGFGV